jgi:dienelactone hydrolase
MIRFPRFSLSRPVRSRFRARGPFGVEVLSGEWFDAARGRTVPVRFYGPRSAGPRPVVFFSHGLGGSPDAYAYLGRHWAGHGFASLHAVHAGTDNRIFTGPMDAAEAMRRAAAAPENWLVRPADIRFCIDRLLDLSAGPRSPWSGTVDPERLAAAGHSMGATTALACAGRLLRDGGGRLHDFKDPRIRVCVAMSPSSGGPEEASREYGSFTAPCVHMTGTRDASPIGGTRLEHRRAPYDAIGAADQVLITFDGLDHMAFTERLPRSRGGGRPAFPRLRPSASDPDPRAAALDALHGAIRAASTAFLDAHLAGNPRSLEWIRAGGLAELLAGIAVVESK